MLRSIPLMVCLPISGHYGVLGGGGFAAVLGRVKGRFALRP